MQDNIKNKIEKLKKLRQHVEGLVLICGALTLLEKDGLLNIRQKDRLQPHGIKKYYELLKGKFRPTTVQILDYIRDDFGLVENDGCYRLMALIEEKWVTSQVDPS